MAMAGLYRRILPSPPAVDFASSEGKQLFAEALQSGTMEGFFKLISHFQTQSEPAYCGLASLSMVLNALAIDPGRKWKGPWRWFDESMLDCCEPLEKVKAEGITFGKVACLAHCAGAKVEAFRTNQSNINDFREYVMRCTSSEDCHVITSYHRAHFNQTGTGHFSPIGGYHAGRDMALILDVARFKYPPHWVPVTLLWQAMDTIDDGTGHHRGFMLISRLQKAPSLLYTLSCRHESWVKIAKYLVDNVPILLESVGVEDVQKVLSMVFTSLPTNFGEFIQWIAEVRRQEDGGTALSQEEKERVAVKEELLKQVRETLLSKHVRKWFSASPCCINLPSLAGKNSLDEIAASLCCQGLELLTGKLESSNQLSCRLTCVNCVKANDDMPVTVVSGRVITGNREEGVDVLVPLSQTKPRSCIGSGPNHCTLTHPAISDVLTVLLLALPPNTWSGIKVEKLSLEIRSLVATENLPLMLQEEVLHLRKQLHFLKKCQEKKVDDDLAAPCLF